MKFKILYATEFCVDQAGGGHTPFTDKVIAFASHLANDEKEFVKIIMANQNSDDLLNPDPKFTMASVAQCGERGLMSQFSVATCQIINIDPMAAGETRMVPIEVKTEKSIARVEKQRDRKRLKAEAKAQDLLRSIIGVEQWRVYRKTNRLILKPNSHFWIIGDYKDSYNKFKPFFGKPDVIRIDNAKKIYATEFCVDQAGGGHTPFTDKVIAFASHLANDEKEFVKTDKVIAFASHLANDEKEFVKTINRIGELKFKTIKESAIWSV
jgi:hypothetical protein